MMKTALVIGATGLVGKSLLKQLLQDDRFSEVIVFGRRSTGFNSPKLTEHLVDFDKPEKWQHLVKGDVLFSTLGTTLKKAGSKAAQYKVDHDYQFLFAAAAARNVVSDYVLVSSIGADDRSVFFYSRIKGKLEKDILGLDFQKIVILRPGPLDGQRQEDRPGERIGLRIIRFLNRLGLFRSYRPIMDHMVASAMIHAVFLVKPGIMIFQKERLFQLAMGKP